MACIAVWAGDSRADSVKGTWLTEGGKSHVRIDDCGDKLCGEIVWLKEPLDDAGEPKTDNNNPDKSLQDRPILGLPLLQGFSNGDEPNVWEGGTIYNPEDGDTYKSIMTLLSANELKVRGYVGISLFGKSQVWTRVD